MRPRGTFGRFVPWDGELIVMLNDMEEVFFGWSDLQQLVIRVRSRTASEALQYGSLMLDEIMTVLIPRLPLELVLPVREELTRLVGVSQHAPQLYQFRVSLNVHHLNLLAMTFPVGAFVILQGRTTDAAP